MMKVLLIFMAILLLVVDNGRFKKFVFSPTSFIKNFYERNYVFFVALYRLLLKIKFWGKRGNEVLVITSGVLGDSIITAQPLLEVQKFCEEHNHRLTIVCTETGDFIFNKTARIQATYLVYKNRDFINKEEAARIRKILSGKKWKILLRFGLHPASLKFSIPVIAEKSVFYSNFIHSLTKKDFKLCKLIFDDMQTPKESVFLPNVCRQMMLSVGMDTFKTKPFIAPVEKSTKTEPYILICPEASNFHHTLDIRQVGMIVRFLKEHYEYKIIISTDNRNPFFSSMLSAMYENSEIILSIAGGGTFVRYMNLVANARLAVSCDSGGAHLAVMLQTPCVTLGGWWEEPNFFPYSYDENLSEDTFRFVSAKKPACAYCRNRMKDFEEAECNERIENRQCVKCLAQINMNDVFHAIGQILGNDKRRQRSDDNE